MAALQRPQDVSEAGRRALQAEKRKVQQLRAQLAAEQQQRSEVQAVMRLCLEESKAERDQYGVCRRGVREDAQDDGLTGSSRMLAVRLE
jgi:hypothetical protein